MDKFKIAEDTIKLIEAGKRPRRRDVALVVNLHNGHKIDLDKPLIDKILKYGWCPACIRYVP